MTYKPEKEREKVSLYPGDVGELPGHKAKSKSSLNGIALRRALGIEPKNRKRVWIYIEKELLEALPPYHNLNFEVNQALEHKITKHQDARVAVLKLDD